MPDDRVLPTARNSSEVAHIQDRRWSGASWYLGSVKFRLVRPAGYRGCYRWEPTIIRVYLIYGTPIKACTNSFPNQRSLYPCAQKNLASYAKCVAPMEQQTLSRNSSKM